MPQRRNGNPQEKPRYSSDKPINRLSAAAGETADTAWHSASDILSSASHKADELAAALGGTMQSLAGNLRGVAPEQDTLGRMAEGVADVLERAGQLLEKEGISGLTEELNQLVRHNPWSAVCVAIGFGFLLAQTRR